MNQDESGSEDDINDRINPATGITELTVNQGLHGPLKAGPFGVKT